MAISMGEMKHFGTRLRAATLWHKNHVTKPPNASNPIIVWGGSIPWVGVNPMEGGSIRGGLLCHRYVDGRQKRGTQLSSLVPATDGVPF